MKASLSLILASLVLLGNPAYAERAPHQQRATRPAPRPMRARPPVRTAAPTSQPAVIPSSTRNETERSENPGQAPQEKQARPDEATGPQGYALSAHVAVKDGSTEADRSASPGQTPPAQSQVQGNQIGADPRDSIANRPNGTPRERANGTWSDDWTDEGVSIKAKDWDASTPRLVKPVEVADVADARDTTSEKKAGDTPRSGD